MRLLCAFILSLSLLGCSSVEPKIVYKTEYQIVEVPVTYKLDRPDRPKYTSNDNAPSYLLKMIQYTNILEIIIDEHK